MALPATLIQSPFKSKTLLPLEIKYLLDNHEAEDRSLGITKADYSGSTPNLSLILYKPGEAPQIWTLEVIGHRDSQLSFNNINQGTGISITEDHPLLWQYSDEQSELYFYGSSKETAKIIVELNQIDADLFGKYQKFDGQLNTLFNTSSGLLSKGSKKLLTKYAACLKRYNIETSIIGGYAPTYSDGKNEFSGVTLKLFFISGSYIIAQDFIFTKTS